MHYKLYKSILSPSGGMNLFRGCTHGCIYCDSRSKCYNFTHDFEDIEVKQDAAAMLDGELSRKRGRGMIATGAMCDPYIPLEAELGVTRAALEVIYKHGFGISLLTKSDLILRDIELLSAINKRAKCVVQTTLTTYDERLCGIIEPNVASTARRAEVLRKMRDVGIPTVVWLCPILPWINDTEENLRGILRYCAESGVRGIVSFGFGLTLREGDREYFYAALDRYFPGLRRRYEHFYGNNYILDSPNSAALTRIFKEECAKNQIESDANKVFAYLREMPSDNGQLSFL